MKTVIFVIMLVISLALAACFTYFRSNRATVPALLMKTVASVGFILLGTAAFAGAKGDVSIILLPGLVMGLVGDIYLDMKFIYPRKDTIYTYAGFGAFILGHIFYLGFLLNQYAVKVPALLISLAIGLACGAGIYFTPRLMKLDYGQFRIISSAYAALLIFLTAYAASLCFAGFTIAKLLFLIGILLFLFSDLVLSQIYFGEDRNTPMMAMINHGSYYLGQILIAASVFFIK